MFLERSVLGVCLVYPPWFSSWLPRRRGRGRALCCKIADRARLGWRRAPANGRTMTSHAMHERLWISPGQGASERAGRRTEKWRGTSGACRRCPRSSRTRPKRECPARVKQRRWQRWHSRRSRQSILTNGKVRTKATSRRLVRVERALKFCLGGRVEITTAHSPRRVISSKTKCTPLTATLCAKPPSQPIQEQMEADRNETGAACRAIGTVKENWYNRRSLEPSLRIDLIAGRYM